MNTLIRTASQKWNSNLKVLLKIYGQALFCAVVFLLSAGLVQAQNLVDGFISPPAETRTMVRWWWFGPSVSDDELVREIKAMKAGGFGGIEIQSVYPLRLENNTSFLSDSFLNSVRLANQTATAEGLRVDITLGSGWPFGGPHISTKLAAKRIKLVEVVLPANTETLNLPTADKNDIFICAFVGKDIANAKLIHVVNDKIKLTPTEEDRKVFLILEGLTGQQVKRPSIGSEGYVLDHMNPEAVQTHLHTVGDKLLAAFTDKLPYSVFSDSLEVYGADWTTDLLQEFKRRRGYDLRPHLLKLFFNGANTAAVKYDWGLTLSELTDERYLTPANNWAIANKTKFRSQTYGFPPVTLSSNHRVALAEGEGAHWRSFSTTRWASSANHLYGNPVTTAESWTWLHQGAFRATPLDIKAEADMLILQGANHFIAHGWPYSPPDAREPGWALYAAAVFNDSNPWWGVMPDVNMYLQRISFLLRQGDSLADVAIFAPQEDAFSNMKPGYPTISDQMKGYITNTLTAQVLDAGYNFDYIDSAAFTAASSRYRVLILPKVNYLTLASYEAIEEFAKSGGLVVAVDNIPDSAVGLINAEKDTVSIREISRRLFGPNGLGYQVSETKLGELLNRLTPPDLAGHEPQIGFIHRKLDGSNIYFVANTGNTAITVPLKFRDGEENGQWWNPQNGQMHAYANEAVSLAPYESRIFVFGKDIATQSVITTKHNPVELTKKELKEKWFVSFDRKTKKPLSSFESWTNEPARIYYSGTVSYSRNLRIKSSEISKDFIRLNFGEGNIVPAPVKHENGTRALLEPPIREAAEVFVNGVRVGAIWTPPYSIELKPYLRIGDNQLEVRVANTSINQLSGMPPIDYKELNTRYGERFKPQNMDNLKPLPSGILKSPILELSK